MGKIRVKTLGIDELEEKEKKEAKKRAEAKKAAVKAVETEEEVEGKKETADKPIEEKLSEVKSASGGKKKEKFAKKDQKAPRSKKYQDLMGIFEKNKTYSLSEGLDILEKLQRKSFDETVELHINTITSGISRNVTLPHGTGKKTEVVIANDQIIAEIEKGIINFDILVAEPTMMPKLAKVAKVLGPRGLMPNPKNGTITPKPEDLVKKYEGGQISFRTEAKAPLLHISVGKVSFGKTKLTENIKSLISAVKKENILKVTLKSTMSPGIKIQI